MSALTNLRRQLIERRLWPVAIILIAALAAVPVTLAKQPVAAPPPPAVQADARNELAQAPIVALAGTGDRAKRRHVLGDTKNPFKLPKLPEAPTTVTSTRSSPQTTDTGSTGSDTTSPGSSGPTGGTTPTAPTAPTAPALPAPKPKVYALHSLTLRFGDAAAASLPTRTVKRLAPLPSAEAPALIYLGVRRDGKTAVFLVDHGVTATGDGVCRPDPTTCETIELKAGETEFFDVTGTGGAVGAQYELDLIKVHTSATTSAQRAKASYAGSKAGRRLLSARIAKDGPIRFVWNAETGKLEKRSGKAKRAVVTHTTLHLP